MSGIMESRGGGERPIAMTVGELVAYLRLDIRVPGRGVNRPGRGNHLARGDRMTNPTTPAIRVNLLRAHGSPTDYQYAHRDCRCVPCRAAMAERHRRYRAAHLDERRAADAAYATEHRAEIAAYLAIYRVAHREEAAVYHATYRPAHRGEQLERERQWSARNPEGDAAKKRNRRSRKVSATGTHTAADIRAQYERQRGRCYWCNAKVGKAYHVDHVFPLVRRGSNGPDNLVIACPACNLAKGAKLPHEFSERLC